MTTQENALAVSQEIKVKGIEAASRQLALIAHDQGDEQLALVVRELHPAVFTSLLGDGDFTTPSVIAPFVSRDQFTEAFNRLGVKWSRQDLDTKLVRLQSQLADFLLSIILPAEGVRKEDLLSALFSDPMGENAILAISLLQKDALEFLEAGTPAHFEKGTWQELLMEIAEWDENHFRAIHQRLSVLYTPQGEEEEEAAQPIRRSPWKFVKGVLLNMIKHAQTLTSDDSPEDKSEKDEVFVDI